MRERFVRIVAVFVAVAFSVPAMGPPSPRRPLAFGARPTAEADAPARSRDWQGAGPRGEPFLTTLQSPEVGPDPVEFRCQHGTALFRVEGLTEPVEVTCPEPFGASGGPAGAFEMMAGETTQSRTTAFGPLAASMGARSGAAFLPAPIRSEPGALAPEPEPTPTEGTTPAAEVPAPGPEGCVGSPAGQGCAGTGGGLIGLADLDLGPPRGGEGSLLPGESIDDGDDDGDLDRSPAQPVPEPAAAALLALAILALATRRRRREG